LVDTEVIVRLPGGDLVVSWRGGAEDTVWLAGDAERMSEGSLAI
ncbi:MAG: diaminopimelate epimerase, partial [Pseudomonadota bacterium]